jgi:hypothetical protein
MYGEEFIHQQYLSDLSVCDKIIDYFESSPQHDGISGNNMNKSFKSCKEVILNDINIINEYSKLLQEVVNNYIRIFPRCNASQPWTIISPVQIQKYEPGEAYFGWHTERSVTFEPMVSRHLVFMTYLNDVTDGGGTEFYHQKLITEARKGSTLIWPVDWTFTHRGEVSPTQTKYIITGWFNYYQPQ